MKEDLIRWYRKNYIQPNCYCIMDGSKVMRASGYYFILERPRNRQPMEPKRVMNKVRIWDGTSFRHKKTPGEINYTLHYMR